MTWDIVKIQHFSNCNHIRDARSSIAHRLLGARSVLSVFEGARARVLNSEHMLGLLVLGLDARRVLGEHQRITEWYKMWEKLTLNAEKIGSSNFKVDIKFTKKFQERKFGNKNLDSRYEISKVWTNFFVEFEKIEFTT